MDEKMTKKQEIEQLKGIAKILDCLWENSYNVRQMDERIRVELEYYFGKNWAHDMYKFAGITGRIATMPRPLKEIIKK